MRQLAYGSAATLAFAIASSAQAQTAPASAPAVTAAPAPVAQARPNVLVWMLDDVGFGQMSTYGGLVPTPNIDRVAALGLRYTNYHTAPICSASRAAMLTGRNPHTVHVGGHSGASMPFPGYDGNIPAEAGTIAAYLHNAGYTTFALGKWDHLPPAEMTPAGPFSHWPMGQGFDHYYGFLSADTDNFNPALIQDNTPVATPSLPDYHLNTDLANQAIAMINSRSAQGPLKPFFMYFATGTAHSPHHAPQAWVERFKGKFDMGWDKAREIILQNQIKQGLVGAGTKLGPRPAGLPEWADLTADQKRLYARQMEVFAASLAYADDQFGRVLDALQQSGELANTVVMITSDNGASAEGGASGTYNEVRFIASQQTSDAQNMAFIDKWGGPETYPHYSYGWAVAGDTPYPYYKQTTHEGGQHVPLVVAWPDRIKAHGEKRGQYLYVDDIAPTILDLTTTAKPEALNGVKQMPFDGISFAYTLSDPKAAAQKHVQYTEMYGNKGLWADDWFLVTSYRLNTWEITDLGDPSKAPWELYNLKKDPTETTDLAAKNPAKVAELAALFDKEAKAHNVYPILTIGAGRPQLAKVMMADFRRRGGKWVFPGPVSHVADFAAPPISYMPYHLTVQLDLLTGHETGPIFAHGGDKGGVAFYLRNGLPMVALRDLAGNLQVLTGTVALTKGANTLELDVDRPPAPAPMDAISLVLKANGVSAGGAKLPYSMPITFGLSEMFDLGIDWGSTVSPDYPVATPFPGKIGKIEFNFNR